eukprot:scaffold47_cov258-Pinguiococcus_pyrenoidosus.AAC.110
MSAPSNDRDEVGCVEKDVYPLACVAILTRQIGRRSQLAELPCCARFFRDGLSRGWGADDWQTGARSRVERNVFVIPAPAYGRNSSGAQPVTTRERGTPTVAERFRCGFLFGRANHPFAWAGDISAEGSLSEASRLRFRRTQA